MGDTLTTATGERIDGRVSQHANAAERGRRLGDVPEVCAITNLKPKNFRRMCDGGKVPGMIRIGRLLRFDLEVIHRWIDQGCPPVRRFDAKGGLK